MQSRHAQNSAKISPDARPYTSFGTGPRNTTNCPGRAAKPSVANWYAMRIRQCNSGTPHSVHSDSPKYACARPGPPGFRCLQTRIYEATMMIEINSLFDVRISFTDPAVSDSVTDLGPVRSPVHDSDSSSGSPARARAPRDQSTFKIRSKLPLSDSNGHD